MRGKMEDSAREEERREKTKPKEKTAQLTP